MATASLVLGIISVILAFVPIVNFLAFISAIVGLVLGIVVFVKKRKANLPKGKAIAGMSLNGAAIVLALLMTVALGHALSSASDGDWGKTTMDDAINQLKSSGLQVGNVVQVQGIENVMSGVDLGYTVQIGEKYGVVLLYCDKDNPLTGQAAERILDEIAKTGKLNNAGLKLIDHDAPIPTPAIARGPFVLTDYSGNPEEAKIVKCFSKFSPK